MLTGASGGVRFFALARTSGPLARVFHDPELANREKSACLRQGDGVAAYPGLVGPEGKYFMAS